MNSKNTCAYITVDWHNQKSDTLVRLHHTVYSSRSDAVAAVCDLFGDFVDDNGNGFSPVPRPDTRTVDEYYVVVDDSWSTVPVVYHDDEIPTKRSYAIAAGFDDAEKQPDDEFVPTIPLTEYVTDAESADGLICDSDAAQHAVESLVADLRYADDCRAYIERSGIATRDGVTARISEEIVGLAGLADAENSDQTAELLLDDLADAIGAEAITDCRSSDLYRLDGEILYRENGRFAIRNEA